MRCTSLFYSLSMWLALAVPALAQTEAKLVVASSPEPAALPAAPVAQPVLRPSQAALIEPAIRPQRVPNHRFFDRTNLQLHLGAVAAETSDLITTREVLEAGGTEKNPVFRPLIRRGLGGQMLVFYGFGEGGDMLASYALHRTGQGLAGASNIRTTINLSH